MTNDIQTRHRTEISDGSFDSFAPLASQSLFWPARYVAPSPMLGALPLLFWLTENTRPRIGVTLGLDDPVAHFALCQAIQKLGLDAMCFGIAPEDGDVTQAMDYNADNYSEFSQILQMDHGPAADLLEDGEIDLLIVARPADMPLQDDIDMHWLPRISSSGAILFLAGGDSLGSYCERISQGAGCFTLDREKGICVALSGDRHNDRLKRLCQLRIGRPGYPVVRNVFTRIGELHSKTAVLDDLTRETRTAHNRAEAAVAQIETLEGRLAAQSAALTQFQQDATQTEQTLKGAVESAQTKAVAVEARATKAEATLAAAQQQIEFLSRERDSAQTRTEKSEARLTDSEQACQTARQQIEALTRERDTAQYDARTARQDIAALNEKFDAVSRNLITQEQETARHSALYGSVKADLDKARLSIGDMETNLAAHLQDIAALTNQRDAANTSLEKAEATSRANAAKYDAASEQIETLKGEMQALREKADEATRQNEERFNDIAMLGRELQTARGELDKAHALIQETQEELAALVHNIAALTNEHDTAKTALEKAEAASRANAAKYDAASEQIETLKGEMQALREKADEATRQNEERFNDIAILGLELQNAETDLHEARARADGQTALLERSVHDNNEARAVLRSEMDAKQHELNDIRAQMDVLRDILREAEHQRDEARHRVTDLEGSSSWRITAPLRRASSLVRRDGNEE